MDDWNTARYTPDYEQLDPIDDPLNDVSLISFSARLNKPANLRADVRQVIYFSSVKQVVAFSRFYLSKFSAEYRVKKFYSLLVLGGAYFQDDMYNEYYFTKYAF